MSEAGVASSSLAVWNFGMEHYMNKGRGKRFPNEQLLFALLPEGQASTTSRGIVFQKLHYSCEFAHSQGWLTDSKSRSVKKLQVRYFDGDTNQLWYKYEGKVYTAQLNDHSEIYRNRNWFDALHRLKLYDKEQVILKRKEREARIEQLQFTSELTAKAKERLDGVKASTTKSPKKQISTVAYIEKKMQESETAAFLRDILSPADETGHFKVRPERVVMPAITKTKEKNLEAMYGE